MLNISKLKILNSKNFIRIPGDINNVIKHRSAFTKEWFNSVYHYNVNNVKNLSLLDLSVVKIITNYFNMFSSRLEKSVLIKRRGVWKRNLQLKKVLIGKPEFKHTNDKVIITLYVYNRELSWIKKKMIIVRRLFLAEYYHRIIVRNISMIKKFTVLKMFGKNLNDIKLKMKNTRKRFLSLINKNRSLNNSSLLKKIAILRLRIPKWLSMDSRYISKYKLDTAKKINYSSFLNIFKIYAKFPIFKQIELSKFMQKRIESKLNYYNNLIRLLKNELDIFKIQYWQYLHYLNKEKRYKKIMWKVKSLNKADNLVNSYNIKKVSNTIQNLVLQIFGSHKILDLKKYNVLTPKFSVNKYIYYLELLKILYNMRLYIRYNRLIMFNKFKFNVFINPLKHFLEKVYKKNVEFNIISLKNYNLNSTMLTKVIVGKLKNRRNSIQKIIKSILSKVRIPITRRLEYYNYIPRNKRLQNIIINNFLNKNYLLKKPIFYNTKSTSKTLIKRLYIYEQNSDKLNMVLKSIYNPQSTIFINNNDSIELKNRRIKNIVLDNINNKIIGGIRIEASGRLTKRITAARSVWKMKQKGTIRNINSSYKKISSLLLRGDFKSNTQYALLNNKTRIGSFGIKGWVSSM